MNLSQELWRLTQSVCRFYNYNNNRHKLENTNKKFEQLGMSTKGYIGYDRDFGHDFHCNWNENDIPLFDINFFHLFLNIFTHGDYIFYFEDKEYINTINVYFAKNELPYTIRFKNNELKLYEVILKELPLKL